MIDLVEISSPFSPQRTRRSVACAPTVGDLLEREGVRGGHTIIHGRAVDYDHPLRGGDELIVFPGRPTGPIVPLIITAIITAAVNIGIGLLVAKLFGPKKPPAVPAGGSATYGWGGITNTVTQGSPIPVIYGEHRVGGQIVMSYRRNLTAYTTGPGGDITNYLYEILAIGHGPLTAIGDSAKPYTTDQDGLVEPNLPGGMRIKGNDANSYNDVQVHLRMGSEGQAALPTGFDKAIQAYNPDLILDTDWTTYKFHGPALGAQVNLDFPKGLYDQTGGGVANRSVTIELERSLIAGAVWLPVTTLTVTEARVSAFTVTILDESFTAGAIEDDVTYRLKRTTAEANDNRIADRVALADVNEITASGGVIDDGIAVIALRIKATDQLSGGRPLVTTMVKGLEVLILDRENSLTRPVLKREYSTNPAWVYLDIALNRRYGMGNQFTLADIPLEAMATIDEWARWCDEFTVYSEQDGEPIDITEATEAVSAGSGAIVITAGGPTYTQGSYIRIEEEGINQIISTVDLGGGRDQLNLVLLTKQAYAAGFTLKKVTLGPQISEKRHQLNRIFDAEGKAWESLISVAQVGRAVPVLMGNELRVRFEDDRPISQKISEASMIADSLQTDYLNNDDVDLVQVQFLDKDQDYDQSVAEPSDLEQLALDRAIVRKPMNLYGITSGPQARREATYHTRAERLIGRRRIWKMPVAGVASLPGDLITLATTLTHFSTTIARASGKLNSLKLSHDLTLLSGKTYKIIIPTPDEPAPSALTITNVPGSYPAGSAIFTNAGVATPIPDESAVAIGIDDEDEIETIWRIISSRFDPADLTVSFEAIEHILDVYRLPGWTLGSTSEEPDGGATETCEGGTFSISLPAWSTVCGYDPEACACIIVNIEAICIITTTPPGLEGLVSCAAITSNHVTIDVDPEFPGGTICIRIIGSGDWECCNYPGAPNPCCIPDDLPSDCSFDFTVCLNVNCTA